ncbi:MAG TPA: hypothetical protein VE046_03145 [Steroidobacteraceae bacterium]|nr:hypothetical protein [Steroidobacteraceae bacterium]
MSPLRKGLLLAALQMLIVSSLGAQLLYDRAHLPRVWVRSAPYDPDLPIRGRYLSLQLVVDFDKTFSREYNMTMARLVIEGTRLRAIEDPKGHNGVEKMRLPVWTLVEPVTFFIPEHADDPSRVKPGETLWVECSIPKRGPPRPIRLGIRRGAGAIEPL